ncbi:MAG: hypothetical protein ACRD25_06745 [Terracidiphilus sp.]
MTRDKEIRDRQPRDATSKIVRTQYRIPEEVLADTCLHNGAPRLSKIILPFNIWFEDSGMRTCKLGIYLSDLLCK